MTKLVFKLVFLLASIGVVVVNAWMIHARWNAPVEATDVELGEIESRGDDLQGVRYVRISNYQPQADRVMCLARYYTESRRRDADGNERTDRHYSSFTAPYGSVDQIAAKRRAKEVYDIEYLYPICSDMAHGDNSAHAQVFVVDRRLPDKALTKINGSTPVIGSLALPIGYEGLDTDYLGREFDAENVVLILHDQKPWTTYYLFLWLSGGVIASMIAAWLLMTR